MSQPDFDYDVVDPDAAERTVPVYPVAQWLNGQKALKALGGVQFTGGVVLPKKYLPGGFALPGWTEERITFRSGKEESALTAREVALAPIRTRFRWFARQGAETAYFPRNAFVMGANMRGHLQALVAVKGAAEPIVITFKGKTLRSRPPCEGGKRGTGSNGHPPDPWSARGDNKGAYAINVHRARQPHSLSGMASGGGTLGRSLGKALSGAR